MARRRRKLSINQTSEVTGVKPEIIESIEKGKVSISTEMFKIENIFDYLSQVATPIALKKNIKLNFVLENQNV